jgi:NAD(P)-dependent dehydrogenase (short-subunit alcohol dehydrogenase family)
MAIGRLEGKVAVITGGASGIGKACAIRFAEEGAEIVISDLGADRLESAAEEIRASTNGRVKWVEANVCFEEQIADLMQSAMDEFGHIDCVVAAAGVSGAHYVSGGNGDSGETGDSLSGNLIDQPLEDWNRVLQINITGVMLTNKLAARHMIANGNPGSIVNIASSAARVALPGAVDYCVSKAGVAMLTQAFAMEMLENNIRVNAIGPGFIETPMTQGLQDDDEGKAMMLGMTPMNRLGTALEMANTALYLACDESSYTTGATLYPNGGMYIS